MFRTEGGVITTTRGGPSVSIVARKATGRTTARGSRTTGGSVKVIVSYALVYLNTMLVISGSLTQSSNIRTNLSMVVIHSTCV